MSQLTTGIIEGSFRYTQAGTPKFLPFQDAIESASIAYSTTQLFVETFSSKGIKGASAACPFQEELTINMGTSNLIWTFLQAALATEANDSSEPLYEAETVVLSDTNATPESTYTLTKTPTTLPGYEVRASDEQGTQYPITVVGSDVTFDADYTGTKVTLSYFSAAAGTNNEIQIGAGKKILETGVYGRFFGCPDTFVVAVPRAVISSSVNLTVGDAPASAEFTGRALRDAKGNFAYLTRVAS